VLATKEKAAPEKADKNFFSFLPFDYRPYLASPYNDPKIHPVATWMLGMPIILSPNSSFADLAQEIKEFFRSSVLPSESKVARYVVPYLQKLIAMLQSPAFQESGAPPDTTPDLNSLGLIDERIASRYGEVVEVKSFWLGVEMLTQQLEVYVWTFQGKMTFSACFNEAFYNEDTVVLFLELFVEVLMKELDVPRT